MRPRTHRGLRGGILERAIELLLEVADKETKRGKVINKKAKNERLSRTKVFLVQFGPKPGNTITGTTPLEPRSCLGTKLLEN